MDYEKALEDANKPDPEEDELSEAALSDSGDAPESDEVVSDSNNEFRWNRNEFFVGGVTKRPTLNEMKHEWDQAPWADLTDVQLAGEILNRADLTDRPFYLNLLKGLTDYFASVESPKQYVNHLRSGD